MIKYFSCVDFKKRMICVILKQKKLETRCESIARIEPAGKILRKLKPEGKIPERIHTDGGNLRRTGTKRGKF